MHEEKSRLDVVLLHRSVHGDTDLHAVPPCSQWKALIMARSRGACSRSGDMGGFVSIYFGGPSSCCSSWMSASRTAAADGNAYRRTGCTSMVTMLPPASGTNQRLQRQASGG